MSWYVGVLAFVGMGLYICVGVGVAKYQVLSASHRELTKLVQRKPTPQDFTTLLEACIDYRKALSRAYVPDATSGPRDIDDICARYGVKLDPRSLYGENPRR